MKSKTHNKFKTNGLGEGKKKVGLNIFYSAIILFFCDPVYFTLAQVFFKAEPIWIPTRLYCALP